MRKNDLISKSLAVTICISFLLPAQPASADDRDLPVGMNISNFSYADPGFPLKNLIHMCAGNELRNDDGSPANPRYVAGDENGYPLSIPPHQKYHVFIGLSSGSHYPSPHYVILYDGEGTIELWAGNTITNFKGGNGRYTFDINEKGPFSLYITSSNPQNHLRNIRIIPEMYESNYEEEPFDPRFVEFLRPFKVVRFMNWLDQPSTLSERTQNVQGGATTTSVTLDANASDVDGYYKGMMIYISNGEGTHASGERMIHDYNGTTKVATVKTPWANGYVPGAGDWYTIDFSIREWSQCSKSSQMSFAFGMPYEYIIQLCNQANVSPWITIPPLASDDYVEQCARLFKAKLNPNLKVYLEWSNETWNYGGGVYGGYKASVALGEDLGIGNNWIYTAYRATQIFKIWNRVYGESDLRRERKTSRLVRVLASQTGYINGPIKATLTFGLSNNPQNPYGAWPGEPMNGLPAYEYADTLAGTLYYGTFDYSDPLTMIAEASKAADDATGTDPALNYLRQTVEYARNFGLDTVIYEGGLGWYPGSFLDPHASTIEENRVRVQAVMDHPAMRTLVKHTIDDWKSIGWDKNGVGVGVFCQYAAFGAPAREGCWGYANDIESVDTAQKYQGALDFIKQNPSTISTTDSLTATAFSVSRIALKWRLNAARAQGIVVARSTDTAGPFDVVAVLEKNAQSYVDSDLPPATTYSYKVWATDIGYESDPSNTASAKTFEAGVPDGPLPRNDVDDGQGKEVRQIFLPVPTQEIFLQNLPSTEQELKIFTQKGRYVETIQTNGKTSLSFNPVRLPSGIYAGVIGKKRFKFVVVR